MVPAASGPEQLVVNGMSPSNRGGRWSNSGMVVELRPEDIGAGNDPLAMMNGRRTWSAPAGSRATMSRLRLHRG